MPGRSGAIPVSTAVIRGDVGCAGPTGNRRRVDYLVTEGLLSREKGVGRALSWVPMARGAIGPVVRLPGRQLIFPVRSSIAINGASIRTTSRAIAAFQTPLCSSGCLSGVS